MPVIFAQRSAIPRPPTPALAYPATKSTFFFPHFALGSESELSEQFITADDSESSPNGIAYARDFLYNDADWPWEKLNYQTIQDADRLDPGNQIADDFDLRPFMDRGGKLIHYNGLADGSIATGSSIYFYNQVLRLLQPQGIDLNEFYCFYLIPCMQHCTGGVKQAPWYIAGANQGDSLTTSTTATLSGARNSKHDVLLALMS